MTYWLEPLLDALRRGETATLVHIAEVRGSAPREAGTSMLVGPHWLVGTIGGGTLEDIATKEARRLAATQHGAIRHFALGPELDQCCGGAVTLAFEPFGPNDSALIEAMHHRKRSIDPIWRKVSITPAGDITRSYVSEGEAVAAVPELTANGAVIFERINRTRPSLYLFGAGHVGRATLRALDPLGFAITWIDDRPGLMDTAGSARTLELAIPESAIEEAPPGTLYLVMTHSHDLDEKICEAVLRRDDFSYLGLIGSQSKRARFLHRLRDMGIADGLIARLICPVGLPSIKAKDPAVIAASIAADLLIRRERGEGL